MNNYINLIITTNEDWPIKMDQSDRRYALFECSDVYKGNFEYFREFKKSVFTTEVGNHFFSYLLDYEQCDIEKIMDTATRTDIINLNKSPAILFMEEISDGIIDISKYWLNHAKKEIDKQLLFKLFADWCQNNGYKSSTSSVFGRSIKKYIEKEGRKYKGPRYYILK